MNGHLDAFARVAVRLGDRLKGDAIETRVGRWLDSDVLKLFKRHWIVETAPGCGIFFSFWIDAEATRRGRIHYNIHALKLRALPGHKIQSREFASAFRSAFVATSNTANWPKLTLDHGPQTLLQGWISLTPETLESDIAAMAERPIALAPLIDTLLAQRAVRPPPA